jgi:hypothetical protein
MSGTALLILAPNSAVVMSDEKENILMRSDRFKRVTGKGKAQRFIHEKISKRTDQSSYILPSPPLF